MQRRHLSTPALFATLVLLGAAVTSGGPAVAQAGPERSETPELVVVLDASGSMAAADAGGGQTRMDAAKQAVTTLAGAAPDDARIGLRTYGDGVDSQAPGSCEDTTARVPVGPVDREAIISQVQSLAPRGDTPIGTALRAAAGDFTDAGPRSVVLVSDGEPTCAPDPCPVAAELAAEGIDVRIDVVGFLVDEAARQILQCIADAGGGQYVDAADAGELAEALDTSLQRTFRSYEPTGTPIDGTLTSDGAPDLGEGQHLDGILSGEVKHYKVGVPEGASVHVGASVIRSQDLGRGGIGGQLILRTFAPSGEQCHFALGLRGGQQGTSLLNGGLLHGRDVGRVGGGSEDCDTATTILLEVEWQFGSVEQEQPMELVVLIEPAVVGSAGTGTEVDHTTMYAEPTLASGALTAVEGGGSFLTAPELSPGGFSDSLRLGESVYYKVPLDWAQQLSVRVDVPESEQGSALDEALGRSVMDLKVFNPVRQSIEPLDAEPINVDENGATATTVTHPIVYGNRAEVAYAEVRHASIPGDMYIQLSISSDGTTDDELGAAIPLTLSVDVLGEAGPGPTYVTDGRAPTAEPSATQSAPLDRGVRTRRIRRRDGDRPGGGGGGR